MTPVAKQDAGALFRRSDPRSGPNALRGYYVGVGRGQAVIARID